MQEAGFAALGLNWRYLTIEVRREDLAAAMQGLRAMNFAGINLTIPHKEAALDIVDKLDPVARRIGAMNCVVVAADGSLEGYNHDAFGYVQSILDAKPDWRADTGPVVVIGAGGGARAVLVSLIDRGAREIRLINRTPARARLLQRELGGPIRAIPWEDRHAALAGAAMLVNTTNQGMVGEPPLELALDRLPTDALVSDIIYIPRETALLAAARRRGNPTVNGLGMLLHQARPAFRGWFGVMPEVTPELRAMIEATT
jgi:shikimate dehydrogenase